MPIRFECSCGKIIKAPSSSVGAKGRCPRCGETIVVPGPTRSSKPISPLLPSRPDTSEHRQPATKAPIDTGETDEIEEAEEAEEIEEIEEAISRQTPPRVRTPKKKPLSKQPLVWVGAGVGGIALLLLILMLIGSGPNANEPSTTGDGSSSAPGTRHSNGGGTQGSTISFDAEMDVPLLQPGTLVADPAPHVAPDTLQTRIALDIKTGERIRWIRFTHAPPHAWLMIEGRKRSRRLLKVDLVAGKPVKILKLPEEYHPEDVSDDGKTVIMWPKSKNVRGSPEYVVLTNIDTGQPLGKVNPWANESSYDQRLKRAMFHGNTDDGIVFMSRYGLSRLSRWNLAQQRLDYQISNLSNTGFAQSPGGRYLFITGKKGFVVLDASSGKPLGQLPASNAQFSGREIRMASFSADGRFVLFAIGGSSESAVVAYDLPGARVVNVTQGRWPVKWISERYALLKNETVYDFTAGAAVWKLDLRYGAHAEGSPDGRHWYVVEDKKKHFLTAVTINPKKLLAGTTEQPPLVGPGKTVSIAITGERPANASGFHNQIHAQLAAKLNKLGIQVRPNQDIQLVVVFETERSKRKVTYRASRGRTKSIELPDDRVCCQLKIMDKKGRTIWRERLFTIMPSVAPRADVASMAATIRVGQWKDMRTNLDELRLPPRVWFNSVRGKSRMTSRGLVKSLR
jgi:hypothetical protein